jgi:hypothetical protein
MKDDNDDRVEDEQERNEVITVGREQMNVWLRDSRDNDEFLPCLAAAP